MPSSSIAAAVRVAEAAEAAEAAAEVRVAQAAEAAAEVRVAQAALLCWRNSPFRTPRSAKVTRPKGLWDALLPKDALPRAHQASTHHCDHEAIAAWAIAATRPKLFWSSLGQDLDGP